MDSGLGSSFQAIMTCLGGVFSRMYSQLALRPYFCSLPVFFWLSACQVDNPGFGFLRNTRLFRRMRQIFQSSFRARNYSFINAFIGGWPTYPQISLNRTDTFAGSVTKNNISTFDLALAGDVLLRDFFSSSSCC